MSKMSTPSYLKMRKLGVMASSPPIPRHACPTTTASSFEIIIFH
ncbi:hypothetical protein GLYMA_04G120900v4 [Glycine max]|uniref:Uncharacterized protein n=1 Tax=Glycine max TaxID=3847 RepID=A0A0R0K7I0_SOYBN|nr:hypothetical protein GYH30_009688 [Glycine max]KRH62631.1 hypothetical protein GLYMA_04G120900v4 [Glycine max]